MCAHMNEHTHTNTLTTFSDILRQGTKNSMPSGLSFTFYTRHTLPFLTINTLTNKHTY